MPSMRLPSKLMVPLVTSPRSVRSTPEIAFSVVVLPAPLAPSSVVMEPSLHLERHALQHQDDVVVDDLDVVDRQHACVLVIAAVVARSIATALERLARDLGRDPGCSIQP